jgi:hypothetical protein
MAEETERKAMSFRLDPDVHRHLRIVLAGEGKTLQALFEDYVLRYLASKEAKYGKPQPRRSPEEVAALEASIPMRP